MRKSFILHLDSLCILDEMTSEQAGEFIKAVYHYQITGELPKLDFAIKMAITPFVNQFARDAEKYDTVVEKRKLAGSMGGKQRVANASKSKQVLASANTSKQNQANQAVSVNDSDNVNDSVSDNDNVNDNVLLKKEAKKKKSEIEIQKIEGSEYGDGELHFLIDEFARKNHDKYTNDMYHLFLLYWTATVLNGSGKGKELWKTQTTFSLAGRLATWSSKSYNNSNQKPQNNYGTAKDRERAELDKRGAELDEMFKQYYAK